MALLSMEEELVRSRDNRPFSNGFEGESWMSLWCEDGCRFVDDCPLISVALIGRTPQPWAETDASSLNRYTCHEYADESL